MGLGARIYRQLRLWWREVETHVLFDRSELATYLSHHLYRRTSSFLRILLIDMAILVISISSATIDLDGFGKSAFVSTSVNWIICALPYLLFFIPHIVLPRGVLAQAGFHKFDVWSKLANFVVALRLYRLILILFQYNSDIVRNPLQLCVLNVEYGLQVPLLLIFFDGAQAYVWCSVFFPSSTWGVFLCVIELISQMVRLGSCETGFVHMSIYYLIMYFILMYYTVAMFYCVLRDIHMKVAYKAISRLNESQTQKAMSLNLVSRDIKMALQDVVGNLVVLSSVVPGLAVPMIPLPRDTSTSTSTNAIPTSTSSAATATSAVSSNSPASLVAQAVTTTNLIADDMLLLMRIEEQRYRNGTYVVKDLSRLLTDFVNYNLEATYGNNKMVHVSINIDDSRSLLLNIDSPSLTIVISNLIQHINTSIRRQSFRQRVGYNAFVKITARLLKISELDLISSTDNHSFLLRRRSSGSLSSLLGTNRSNRSRYGIRLRNRVRRLFYLTRVYWDWFVHGVETDVAICSSSSSTVSASNSNGNTSSNIGTNGAGASAAASSNTAHAAAIDEDAIHTSTTTSTSTSDFKYALRLTFDHNGEMAQTEPTTSTSNTNASGTSNTSDTTSGVSYVSSMLPLWLWEYVLYPLFLLLRRCFNSSDVAYAVGTSSSSNTSISSGSGIGGTSFGSRLHSTYDLFYGCEAVLTDTDRPLGSDTDASRRYNVSAMAVVSTKKSFLDSLASQDQSFAAAPALSPAPLIVSDSLLSSCGGQLGVLDYREVSEPEDNHNASTSSGGGAIDVEGGAIPTSRSTSTTYGASTTATGRGVTPSPLRNFSRLVVDIPCHVLAAASDELDDAGGGLVGGNLASIGAINNSTSSNTSSTGAGAGAGNATSTSTSRVSGSAASAASAIPSTSRSDDASTSSSDNSSSTIGTASVTLRAGAATGVTSTSTSASAAINSTTTSATTSASATISGGTSSKPTVPVTAQQQHKHGSSATATSLDGFTTIIEARATSTATSTTTSSSSGNKAGVSSSNNTTSGINANTTTTTSSSEGASRSSRLLATHRVAVIMRNKSLLSTTTAALHALRVKYKALHFCRNAPRFTNAEIAHFGTGYFTIYMYDSMDLGIELHQLRVDGYRVLFASNAIYSDALRVVTTSSRTGQATTTITRSACNYCLPIPCPVLLMQQLLLDRASATSMHKSDLLRTGSKSSVGSAQPSNSSSVSDSQYSTSRGGDNTATTSNNKVPGRLNSGSGVSGSGRQNLTTNADGNASANASGVNTATASSNSPRQQHHSASGPVPLGRTFVERFVRPYFNRFVAFIQTIPAFEHVNTSVFRFISMIVKIFLRVIEWFLIERVDAGSTSNMRPHELLSFENHNHLGNDFRFKGTFLGIPIFSRHIEERFLIWKYFERESGLFSRSYVVDMCAVISTLTAFNAVPIKNLSVPYVNMLIGGCVFLITCRHFITGFRNRVRFLYAISGLVVLARTLALFVAAAQWLFPYDSNPFDLSKTRVSSGDPIIFQSEGNMSVGILALAMEMMLPIELIIAPLLNYIWELALLNIALLVARVLIFAIKVNVLYLPAEICQGLLLAIVLWTCGGVSRLFDVEYALRIEFQSIHLLRFQRYFMSNNSSICWTEMRHPVKTGILKHRNAIIDEIISQLLVNSVTYSSTSSGNGSLNSSRSVDGDSSSSTSTGSNSSASDAGSTYSDNTTYNSDGSGNNTTNTTTNSNTSASSSKRQPVIGLLNNDKYQNSDIWDRIRNLNYGFLKIEKLYAMLYLRDLLRRKAPLDVSTDVVSLYEEVAFIAAALESHVAGAVEVSIMVHPSLHRVKVDRLVVRALLVQCIDTAILNVIHSISTLGGGNGGLMQDADSHAGSVGGGGGIGSTSTSSGAGGSRSSGTTTTSGSDARRSSARSKTSTSTSAGARGRSDSDQEAGGGTSSTSSSGSRGGGSTSTSTSSGSKAEAAFGAFDSNPADGLGINAGITSSTTGGVGGGASSQNPLNAVSGLLSPVNAGINRQSSWYGGGIGNNELEEAASGGSVGSSSNSANHLLEMGGSDGFDTGSVDNDRGGIGGDRHIGPAALLRRRSSAFVSNWTGGVDYARSHTTSTATAASTTSISSTSSITSNAASAFASDTTSAPMNSEYAAAAVAGVGEEEETHTDYRDILSAEKTRFDLHEVLIQIGYPPCAYSNTRRQYRKRGRGNESISTGVFSESEADAFIRDEILYPFLKPMTLATAIKEELLYRNISVSEESLGSKHSGRSRGGSSYFYSGTLSGSSEDALSSGYSSGSPNNNSSSNVSGGGGHSSIDVNRNQSAVYSEGFQAGGDSVWHGSNSPTHNGVMTARNGGHWLTVAVVDTGARALADRRPNGHDICKSVVERCLEGTFDSHMVQHELAGSNFNNITRFTIPFEPVEVALPVPTSGERQAWKAQTTNRFSGFERPQKYFEFLRDILLRRFTPAVPGSIGVGAFRPMKRNAAAGAPSGTSSSTSTAGSSSSSGVTAASAVATGGGSSSTEAVAVSTNYQRSMLVVHSDMSIAEAHAAPFRLQGWVCYIAPNNNALLTHPKLHDTDAVLVCNSCRNVLLTNTSTATSAGIAPMGGSAAGASVFEVSITDVLKELGYQGAVVCVMDVAGGSIAVLNKTFSLVLSIPILTHTVEAVNAYVDRALLSFIIGATPHAQSSS